MAAGMNCKAFVDGNSEASKQRMKKLRREASLRFESYRRFRGVASVATLR